MLDGDVRVAVVDEGDAVYLETQLPDGFDVRASGSITGRDLERVRFVDADFEEPRRQPRRVSTPTSSASRKTDGAGLPGRPARRARLRLVPHPGVVSSSAGRGWRRTAAADLVAAPAGFGKTTLLAQWLAAAGSARRRVAWLALDPGDADLRVFLTASRGGDPDR